MTDQQYIEQARALYQADDGDIEIDEGAIVSRGESLGAYVQAWVWVESDDGEPSCHDPDSPCPNDEKAVNTNERC